MNMARKMHFKIKQYPFSQYILNDTLFKKSWFTFDLILGWGWIIELLCQLHPTTTFNNCLNCSEKKEALILYYKMTPGIGSWIFFLVTLHYTFDGITVICLSAKHNVICWFFWDPIPYNALHCISVQVSDCSASLPRNMVTLLGLLSTLYDLPLWFAGLYMPELSIRC